MAAGIGYISLVPDRPALSALGEFWEVQDAVLRMQNVGLRDQLLDVLKTNYPDVVDEEVRGEDEV